MKTKIYENLRYCSHWRRRHGAEVTAEALKVAEAAAKKFGFKLNWHHYDFGGERYLKTGEVLPDSAVDELRKFKAMYPAPSAIRRSSRAFWKKAFCSASVSSWNNTSTSAR